MSIRVVKNELPPTVRRSVAATIATSFPENESDWMVSMTSDAKNRAWDVEVRGPQNFHWMRRFSGEDRDAEVVAETIRAALADSGQKVKTPLSPELSDALSSLAIQGIAFTGEPGENGERKYVVDRVELKESEIVYLHKQGALTADGIRSYLLNRG